MLKRLQKLIVVLLFGASDFQRLVWYHCHNNHFNHYQQVLEKEGEFEIEDLVEESY